MAKCCCPSKCSLKLMHTNGILKRRGGERRPQNRFLLPRTLCLKKPGLKKKVKQFGPGHVCFTISKATKSSYLRQLSPLSDYTAEDVFLWCRVDDDTANNPQTIMTKPTAEHVEWLPPAQRLRLVSAGNKNGPTQQVMALTTSNVLMMRRMR